MEEHNIRKEINENIIIAKIEISEKNMNHRIINSYENA